MTGEQARNSMYITLMNEKDEEILRLSDLNKAKGALIKAQAKKIGVLLKEKEWYKDKAVEFMFQLWEYDGDIKSAEASLLKEMQQVMKED